MEPIGQATQFAQTAMDMANKVARQQAEDPSAFFPQELQNQAAQIQERFAENPSPMSITQTGNAGSAFSDMVGKLVSDGSVEEAHDRKGQATQARPGKECSPAKGSRYTRPSLPRKKRPCRFSSWWKSGTNYSNLFKSSCACRLKNG